MISVVIPTYNRGKTTVVAVESVLRQDYLDLEIIVVDDGSVDDTRNLLQEVISKDTRVKYIFQKNAGVAAARNTGIRNSSGNFIAFLDSDDRWMPGKLSLQMECFQQFPNAGMVWTDMSAINPSGEIVHQKYLRKMYHAYSWYPRYEDLFEKKHPLNENVAFYCGNLFSPMVLGNLVHTSTTLIRREIICAAGGYPENYRTGEDYPYYLKICKLTPVAFVDQALVYYQIGMQDALSSKPYNRQIAHHFLETLLHSIKENRDLISLPKGRLEECLANAYSWVANAELNENHERQAIHYFLKSIKYKPWQLGAYAKILSAFLPVDARNTLVKIKKRLI